MNFLEAIDLMRNNIPVRNDNMKKGEYLIIDENAQIRIASSHAGYSMPYCASLSDYDEQWHSVDTENIANCFAEALTESKSFFDAIGLMYRGFICKMKEDVEDCVYAIDNSQLLKITIGDTQITTPTRRHYEGTWYAIGFNNNPI